LTVGGLSDGSSCTAASQCTGGYCVHNICRSSATYCGDNYCDGGEVGSCVADCGAVEAKTWVETERGKASITIPTIAASSMATVEIEKTEDLAMRQISISVANKVNSVAIKIEKLDAKPAELEKPTDKVYHYIEVTKANIMDNDINNVKFQFAVDKSWLNENNIDPSRVGLNRWTPTPSISGSFIGFLNNLFSITGFAIVEPGEWNKLTTTKVSETTDEIIYEAESPGLSFFSIVGETVAVVPTAPPTAPTIPPTDYTWIWIIIIIIIIGGGYWYFKLKKPSK
ncbi:MAG: PGF-pre-PGF domain-containing protein, partial [Candidatus Aenigmatarchaeota archaeon]